MKGLWREMDQDAGAGIRPFTRSFGYLAATVLAVAGAVVHSMVVSQANDSRGVVLFFVPGVLVATGLGGLWPGVFATALGLLLVLGVLTHSDPDAATIADTSLFAVMGIAIAMGGHRLWSFRQRAVESNRQLSEREAHLQSILDTVPEAMIVIDESGIIRSVGPMAELLFGWTRHELEGRNVRMLMPAPDREAHDGHLARYARTGERHIIGIGRMVLAQRKNGSAFPAELTIGEMKSGGHTYFTGFLRDLTNDLESESQFQLLRSELVHISRLSAMGEMAATLAHELNQPLSAISNYLKGGQRLLEAEHPDSKAIAPIVKAAEQSLRAGQIIRRLRDFVARGETERRVESLPKLLEEVSSLGLLGVKERNIAVQLDRDPAVDLVMVDKVQVQQVLLNLIRNALEAMDSGRGELVISLRTEGEEMVRVSVADTGAGISAEIADRLFQPFVSTKNGQGMGVGLSICRTIIEAHGGRIWAEPRPEGGTIFSFTVPIAAAQEAG